MKTGLILMAVVAAVAAVPTMYKSYEPSIIEDFVAKYDKGVTYEYSTVAPNYSFSYEVKDKPSGLDLGHSESRKNDDTKGKYYVFLPDGRQMVVTYNVEGQQGYVANVEYIGEAEYETEYSTQPWPQYQPPAATKQQEYKPEYETREENKPMVTPQPAAYAKPTEVIQVIVTEPTVYVEATTQEAPKPKYESTPAYVERTEAPYVKEEPKYEENFYNVDRVHAIGLTLFREEVLSNNRFQRRF